jgi:hypothetical protein
MLIPMAPEAEVNATADVADAGVGVEFLTRSVSPGELKMRRVFVQIRLRSEENARGNSQTKTFGCSAMRVRYCKNIAVMKKV